MLSYVGLVVAALAGVDIARLLRSASTMRQACGGADPGDNPGAYLGAYLGAAASSGHDKITLMTSPSVSTFGLWVDQLLAECLGKDGHGLVPVINEPPLEATDYSALSSGEVELRKAEIQSRSYLYISVALVVGLACIGAATHSELSVQQLWAR